MGSFFHLDPIRICQVFTCPNEVVSAVVDLSNHFTIVSQLLTFEGLTLQILYDSTSALGIPKLKYHFIYLELKLLQE